MKLPSQQTNKWLQALYATHCDAGHSSGTHAYVSIDFKACAHRPSMQKLSVSFLFSFQQDAAEENKKRDS